jgi:hypothetical protein
MNTHIEDKKKIKKNKNESDVFSEKEHGQLAKWMNLLHAKLKEFDVTTVKDEQHLRSLIMDKVLEAAARFFTVSTQKGNGPKGPAIPLKDLPEEERAELLSNLMLKILGDIEGPGPVLRRYIARLILDYRLFLRMKKHLETLTPSSVKHRIASKSICHLELKMSEEMFFFYAWPLSSETKRKKEFLERREKLLKEVFENPEALMEKE